METMENPALDTIKTQIVAFLKATYGYCGVAEGKNFCLINSGDETEITIEINEKPSS
jgi:hypothetical protein